MWDAWRMPWVPELFPAPIRALVQNVIPHGPDRKLSVDETQP